MQADISPPVLHARPLTRVGAVCTPCLFRVYHDYYKNGDLLMTEHSSYIYDPERLGLGLTGLAKMNQIIHQACMAALS